MSTFDHFINPKNNQKLNHSNSILGPSNMQTANNHPGGYMGNPKMGISQAESHAYPQNLSSENGGTYKQYAHY